MNLLPEYARKWKAESAREVLKIPPALVTETMQEWRRPHLVV